MSKDVINHINIENQVYFIRDVKVMLDKDLAVLYGVETKRLNEQVKRNIDRFPVDFMFQLSQQEWDTLRSQFATSIAALDLESQIATSKRGGRRTLPYVFTEHGAIMLASVLNSKQAISASIQVVKAFIKLREILTTHKQLATQLKELETKYDIQFKEVFGALQEIMERPKENINRLILKKGVKE